MAQVYLHNISVAWHWLLLLQKLWFPLTTELLEIAVETRVEMLATARNCYWKASKCEADGSEEEWLHHYMMGKVMEKQRAHPRLYLEHYKQVCNKVQVWD